MLRIGAVALATLGLIACSAPFTDSSSDDWKPFGDLVRHGLTAEENAFVPDPPVCPGPVPFAVREHLIAGLSVRLSAYFAEPQLAKEISLATGVVQEKDGPACLYGGGVDWVRLDSVSINGNSAVAAGQVRLWTKLAQWQGKPVFAEPHNTVDATFGLARQNGHWMITHYAWTFARGSEP